MIYARLRLVGTHVLYRHISDNADDFEPTIERSTNRIGVRAAPDVAEAVADWGFALQQTIGKCLVHDDDIMYRIARSDQASGARHGLESREVVSIDAVHFDAVARTRPG